MLCGLKKPLNAGSDVATFLYFKRSAMVIVRWVADSELELLIKSSVDGITNTYGSKV